MSVPGVFEVSESSAARGELVNGVVATLTEWCDEMGIPDELRAQTVVALAEAVAA